MITQDLYITILTIIYTLSSWVGFVIFAYIWYVTHQDRKELPPEQRADPAIRRIAKRNEIAALILTVVFAAYSLVGVIGIIRTFEIIHLPWQQGLVTVTLLVFGNFVEMLLAIVLLRSRRAIKEDQ